MHRLTLAWLFAQECWGQEVLQRFPVQGSGRQEEMLRPPLLGDSVPPWEGGCGLEEKKGGFPPTGPLLGRGKPHCHSFVWMTPAELSDWFRTCCLESALLPLQDRQDETDGSRVAVAQLLAPLGPWQAAPPALLCLCALGTLPQVTQLQTGTEGLVPALSGL